MRQLLPVLALALVIGIPSAPAQQQAADPDYRPQVKDPTFTTDGPAVAIDQAHRNFHTIDGRYAPFASLLRADGYRVTANAAAFSAGWGEGTNILVIANARADAGQPAFSAEEIAAIVAWVAKGGALLLIADHAPYGGAAAPLAAAFGVEMGQGYVAVQQDGKVTSRIAFSGRALGAHPILAGRKADERVRRAESFTGQSLSVPQGGAVLLMLPDDALEVAGRDEVAALRRGERVPGRRVGGRAQAVAIEHGKGRVVIAGEAAMFTAQHMPRGNGDVVGLEVTDNQRFARNVMRWLARAIP